MRLLDTLTFSEVALGLAIQRAAWKIEFTGMSRLLLNASTEGLALVQDVSSNARCSGVKQSTKPTAYNSAV